MIRPEQRLKPDLLGQERDLGLVRVRQPLLRLQHQRETHKILQLA